MTTVVVALSGSGTWTIPADWNDAANTIELIGCGGGGYPGASTYSGGGGGGGSYVKMTNVPIKAHYLAGNITGLDYYTSDTYSPYNYSSIFLQGIQYYSGGTPVTGYLFYAQGVVSYASGTSGGVGGSVTTSQQIVGTNYYTLGYAGGNGGNGRTASSSAGAGGGGAGGPGGPGGKGGTNTTTNATQGRGGGGGGGGLDGYNTGVTPGWGGSGADGGYGVTTTPNSGNPGGTSIYGGGGGGGGGDGSSSRKGGDGGPYGGGGGGAGSTNGSQPGTSSLGVIVITYTAYIPPPVSNTMFLMF